MYWNLPLKSRGYRTICSRPQVLRRYMYIFGQIESLGEHVSWAAIKAAGKCRKTKKDNAQHHRANKYEEAGTKWSCSVLLYGDL